MPYNPRITFDPSPIYAGTIAGANAKAAGLAQAGAAIGRGIENVGAGFEKRKQTTDELDFLNGMAGKLKTEGAITDDEYQKFLSGSIGSKRGIVSIGGTKLNQIYKEQLAKQKENSFAFDPKKDIINDPSGRGFFARTSASGGGNFFPNKMVGGGMEDADRFSQQTLDDGTVVTKDNATGKPIKVLAPGQGAGKLDVNSLLYNQTQQQIDELNSDISKGNNYSGPDWLMKWMGGKTNAEKVKELEKTQSTFKKPRGSVAPGLPAPKENPETSSVTPPSTKKVLTPEIAAVYLRKAGGDRKKAQELAAQEGY